MAEETLVDRLIKYLKNQPVIAVSIAAGMVLTAVVKVIEAVIGVPAAILKAKEALAQLGINTEDVFFYSWRIVIGAFVTILIFTKAFWRSVLMFFLYWTLGHWLYYLVTPSPQGKAISYFLLFVLVCAVWNWMGFNDKEALPK